MTKLLATVSTVLAAQALAAGCVIEVSSLESDGTGELAAISARWSLRNMIDGAVTGCPSGFDTVEMITQATDGSGAPVGEPTIDLFDCRHGAGISSALVPDVYQVWLEVRSHDLSELYAQSLSQVLDVRRADQQLYADILNDGGYFQVSWDLVGASSQQPLGCSQVGFDGLATISTAIADPRRAYDDAFTCESHAAVSGGLLQGSYTITIDAMAGRAAIGRITSLTNQPIYGQNRVTDLGHILIPIEGY
jgi:hypothetical protein